MRLTDTMKKKLHLNERNLTDYLPNILLPKFRIRECMRDKDARPNVIKALGYTLGLSQSEVKTDLNKFYGYNLR